MNTTQDLEKYFAGKLSESKTHFERALECKHTEFDDLYPYMNEHPQFFWYKRYVAWQELLTAVKFASELGINWEQHFTENQIGYIHNKVLEGKVLDFWFQSDEKSRKVEEEVN